MPSLISARVWPCRTPQQRDSQTILRPVDTLGAIEKHRQPTARSLRLRCEPGDHRNLPSGCFTGRDGDRRALDHTSTSVRGNANGRPGQGKLEPQQLMALLPVDGADQFDPWRIRLQTQIQPQTTGSDGPSQREVRHQFTLLQPLKLPLANDFKAVIAVIGSQIPGIPELATIPISPQ